MADWYGNKAVVAAIEPHLPPSALPKPGGAGGAASSDDPLRQPSSYTASAAASVNAAFALPPKLPQPTA